MSEAKKSIVRCWQDCRTLGDLGQPLGTGTARTLSAPRFCIAINAIQAFDGFLQLTSLQNTCQRGDGAPLPALNPNSNWTRFRGSGLVHTTGRYADRRRTRFFL